MAASYRGRTSVTRLIMSDNAPTGNSPPQIVPNDESCIDGFDDKFISIYAAA